MVLETWDLKSYSIRFLKHCAVTSLRVCGGWCTVSVCHLCWLCSAEEHKGSSFIRTASGGSPGACFCCRFQVQGGGGRHTVTLGRAVGQLGAGCGTNGSRRAWVVWACVCLFAPPRGCAGGSDSVMRWRRAGVSSQGREG